VFIVIAVYVGAIVTTNTFATIIAGRTRTIALLRLIGASAATLRRSVAGEGLLVGVLGAIIGGAVGLLVTVVGVRVLVAVGAMPDLAYGFLSPVLVFPVVVVALTTWLAAWIGSRRVLSVTPMQATGAAEEPSREEGLARRGRNIVAITLVVIGVALLGLGVLVGLVSPVGVLIGLIGGVVSFTGLVFGAHLVMPPALRFTGTLLGRSAPARLAAANAVRYPERSSRTTIGLVIGVTLITMFAVATQSYRELILRSQQNSPESYQGAGQVLDITTSVFSVLIGFSAVIAAVGMINNLSLSVLQRSRELGLLRALGFSAGQVRSMILAESVQMTVASVLVGIVLGVFYGWAGAQSLLGSIKGSPGLVAPGLPWLVVVLAAVGAAILALVASVAPTRRATRLSPVVALAVE
jgi:putative ABC transport system permease protein